MSQDIVDEPLAGLGRAIAEAAQALAALPAQDDLAAYRYVTDLDEALRPLADLFSAVSDIVEFADVSPALGRRLAGQQAELARRRGEIEAARAALDAWRGVERDLTAAAAEADRLRAQVGELETAQRMTAEIPVLRSRLRDLESVVPAASAAEATQITEGIRAAAERFSQLTACQLEVLGRQVRSLVDGATAAAAEISERQAHRDAVAAELAEREKQSEELREELERTLPALAAWRQADADLADGLRQAGLEAGASPLEAVRAELAGLSQRMSDLEERLRPLFAEHAQEYHQARQVMNLSGRSGAATA